MGIMEILIADDDESITQLLSMTLTQQGFRVTITHDGESALQMLEREKFDLLITDQRMPRLNGNSLVRKVREGNSSNRSIPVLIISGSCQKDGVPEICDQYPPAQYIEKPYDLDHDLLPKMRDILQHP